MLGAAETMLVFGRPTPNTTTKPSPGPTRLRAVIRGKGGIADAQRNRTSILTPYQKAESATSDADSDRLTQIAREIELQIVAARLDSPNRLAPFFGQVQQEVGPGLRLVECLDYRADRLGSIFRYFSRNPDEALLFGRTADQPADQEAIAERAYADRIGNGGVESGDGWRFRGRGLKQVTGRANYRAFTEDHAQLFGERIDFEAEPELLGTPRYAVRSALWFWRANDLFELADAGISRVAADSITEIINPGTDSYSQRWENVQNLSDSEVFANICRFSVAKPRFEGAE